MGHVSHHAIQTEVCIINGWTASVKSSGDYLEDICEKTTPNQSAVLYLELNFLPAAKPPSQK